MSKFVRHKRWDNQSANDGVDFEIFDDLANDWGTFRCILIDASNPRFKAAAEVNARKANAAEKAIGGKNEKLQVKLNIDFAFNTWLIGWELKGSDGKSIPFTRENAHEYFGECEHDEATGKLTFPTLWVLTECANRASEKLNFQPQDQDGLPEKN